MINIILPIVWFVSMLSMYAYWSKKQVEIVKNRIYKLNWENIDYKSNAIDLKQKIKELQKQIKEQLSTIRDIKRDSLSLDQARIDLEFILMSWDYTYVSLAKEIGISHWTLHNIIEKDNSINSRTLEKLKEYLIK